MLMPSDPQIPLALRCHRTVLTKKQFKARFSRHFVLDTRAHLGIQQKRCVTCMTCCRRGHSRASGTVSPAAFASRLRSRSARTSSSAFTRACQTQMRTCATPRIHHIIGGFEDICSELNFFCKVGCNVLSTPNHTETPAEHSSRIQSAGVPLHVPRARARARAPPGSSGGAARRSSAPARAGSAAAPCSPRRQGPGAAARPRRSRRAGRPRPARRCYLETHGERV